MDKKIRGIMILVVLLTTLCGQYRLHAQADDFFYISEDVDYSSSGGWDMSGFSLVDEVDNTGAAMLFGESVVQDNETQDVLPLGSGLAILVAAGAGYAIVRKRNNNVKHIKR